MVDWCMLVLLPSNRFGSGRVVGSSPLDRLVEYLSTIYYFLTMEFDDLKPQYTNILLSIDYFSSSIFLFDIINLSML